MTKASYTVTSVGDAPSAERNQRMRKYAITMGIRMACIAAMPFVRGWWIVLCATGAIFLPYIAVVLANVKNRSHADDAVEHATLEIENSVPSDLSDVRKEKAPEVFIADEGAVRVTGVEKSVRESH